MQIRKAARLALHAPKGVRTSYLEQKADIEKSKKMTKRLAKQYLTNPDRSETIRRLVDIGQQYPDRNPLISAILN